jgi:hypothetical protein
MLNTFSQPNLVQPNILIEVEVDVECLQPT